MLKTLESVPNIDAHAGTKLAISDEHGTTSVELYSPEGLAAVSALWTKLSVHYKLMYQAHWMGVQIIQLPPDILVLQELIWRLKPDVVLECGVAHGGSLILYASVLEILRSGHVVGVDVEIRKHNRETIESHPLSNRITLIEGSSIASETVRAVQDLCEGKNVLVLLDSNHTTEHVYAEIKAYSNLVPRDGYLVVMDGGQALVADVPNGKAEWATSSPLHAIERFLAETDAFVVDDACTRFGITSNTRGYLKRVR